MKKIIFTIALTLITTNTVSANNDNGPTWDFIELGYIQANVDDTDFKPTGFTTIASALVSENIYVTASYYSISDSATVFGTQVETDIKESTIGLGYQFGISDMTDFSIGIKYLNGEVCANSQGFGSNCLDDNGFGLNVGFRTMISDKVEASIAANYVDISDDSDTSLDFGIAYIFSQDFSAKFSFTTSDDVNTIGLGVRFEF